MKAKALLLFDIDGVIRDVSQSYRLALKETVYKYSNHMPNNQEIDLLKNEGCWNNDWDASLELIKRNKTLKKIHRDIPSKNELINTFSNFYFGNNSTNNPSTWNGFIKNEPLLIEAKFFQSLTGHNFKWGFVSGAEPQSAKYVLQERLKLESPYLIAMGDAPDKPDPKGLIQLSEKILNSPLGENVPQIVYIGDTVADMKTIQNARKKHPMQSFLGIGIAPPHLHTSSKQKERIEYESNLKLEGADQIISNLKELIKSF